MPSKVVLVCQGLPSERNLFGADSRGMTGVDVMLQVRNKLISAVRDVETDTVFLTSEQEDASEFRGQGYHVVTGPHLDIKARYMLLEKFTDGPRTVVCRMLFHRWFASPDIILHQILIALSKGSESGYTWVELPHYYDANMGADVFSWGALELACVTDKFHLWNRVRANCQSILTVPESRLPLGSLYGKVDMPNYSGFRYDEIAKLANQYCVFSPRFTRVVDLGGNEGAGLRRFVNAYEGIRKKVIVDIDPKFDKYDEDWEVYGIDFERVLSGNPLRFLAGDNTVWLLLDVLEHLHYDRGFLSHVASTMAGERNNLLFIHVPKARAYPIDGPLIRDHVREYYVDDLFDMFKDVKLRFVPEISKRIVRGEFRDWSDTRNAVGREDSFLIALTV